jgi:hypothetical protein
MSTWSAEAAQRDNERLELSRLQMEKSLQDRRILDMKGNVLWAQLRSLLGKKCNEFNAEPGKTGVLSCDANLLKCKIWLTGKHHCIIGTYGNSTLQFLGIGPVRYEAYWHVNLTSDGLSVWLSDNENCPVTLDEISDAVIETLLAGR